jgi:hypothetical protein
VRSTVPYSSLSAAGPAIGRAIGRHLDVAFRAIARGATVANEPGFLRVISGEAHPLGNFALLSGATDLATARAAVEPLAAASLPSAVLFAGMEAPAEIADWLAASGYARHGAMPAMGVDIDAMAATELPAGYAFERIGAGADAEEWERQFAAGYELPPGVARYFSPVNVDADPSPDAALQFFAVRRDGAIVATSALYLHDGLAGVYSVSTVPAERRKGLGAHATAEALRAAGRLGYGVGVLQSSEAGYPIYRKLGFADFGGIPIFVRIPA